MQKRSHCNNKNNIILDYLDTLSAFIIGDAKL